MSIGDLALPARKSGIEQKGFKRQQELIFNEVKMPNFF